MDEPNGFDRYLVKTKWGGIYLIGNPMTKKGINYYDSIFYDCCSLKDEDIEEWVGVDDTSFNQRERLIRQSCKMVIEFFKETRQMKMECVTPEYIDNWISKQLEQRYEDQDGE
jgi:hypothetical protein